MPAAENEGNRRRLHPAYQLCNRKPRFNIAADRIEDDEQSFDLAALLNRHKLRYDVLVLGRFVLRGKDIVPFDLPNHGQTMDQMPVFGNGDRAGLDDLTQKCAALKTALGGLHEEILAAMADLRGTVDSLERLVADECWPLPKYREMLFVY